SGSSSRCPCPACRPSATSPSRSSMRSTGRSPSGSRSSALPARRGRSLRQPHPPAARRGRGARPAEPPPPPADPPPVGGQGRDAEPPRRVPARAFLFGAERVPLERVRGPIIELREGRCFYCAERLASRAGQTPDVDHFIPWSRYPDDGLENLVVAHARCNAQRDF